MRGGTPETDVSEQCLCGITSPGAAVCAALAIRSTGEDSGKGNVVAPLINAAPGSPFGLHEGEPPSRPLCL